MQEAESRGRDHSADSVASLLNKADRKELGRRLRSVERDYRRQRERVLDRQLRKGASDSIALREVAVESWVEPRAVIRFWEGPAYSLTTMSPDALSRFLLHCRRRGAFLVGVARMPWRSSYHLRFKDAQGQRFGITAVVTPRSKEILRQAGEAG